MMKRISHFLRLKSRPLQSLFGGSRRRSCLRCVVRWARSDIRFERGAVNRKNPIDFTIASTDPMTRHRAITSLPGPFQFPFRDARMAVC